MIPPPPFRSLGNFVHPTLSVSFRRDIKSCCSMSVGPFYVVTVVFHWVLIRRATNLQHTSRYFVTDILSRLVANLELRKHGGAHSTHSSDVEKKTEASFVCLDYATEDKEMQKSKQTKSFRLLKSSKNPQLHCQQVLPANLPMCLLKCSYVRSYDFF